MKLDRERQILEFEKAGKVQVIPNNKRMESTGQAFWMGKGLPRGFINKGRRI